MTINPQQTTALVGDLGTRGVHRPTPTEPRRASAAAPPSEVARDAAAKRDETEAAPSVASDKPVPLPGFPLQELAIRKDPEINRVVVQVVDSQTRELVRQIPSEEWVRVLKRLKGAKGLFVDRKG